MAKKPAAKPKPTPAPAPAPAPNANTSGSYPAAGPRPDSPYIQQAQQNLQQQVSSGGINQAQADAELARLRGQAAQTTPNTSPNIKLNDPGSVIQAATDTARQVTPQGQLLTNPNQNNAFGSSQVTIDPVTGQPTVNQNLSQGNQDVVKGTQGSAVNASNVLGGILGQGGAYQNAVNHAGPQQGPSQDLINSIYGHLTKDTGQAYGREKEQLDQTLTQRGIPVGSQAYSNAMHDLDTRYDNLKSDAMNTATTNAYGQSVNQQNANTNSLQGIAGSVNPLNSLQSTGYFDPKLQGFQSVGFQQPDVNSIFNTVTGQNIAKGNNQTALQVAQTQTAGQKAVAGINANSATNVANISATHFNSTPPGSLSLAQ